MIPDKVDQLFSKLSDHTSKGGDPSSLLIKLEPVLHRYILPLIDEFRSAGREASTTFCVWDDFLRNVIMKLFLYATRERDWQVYQAAKAMLLPLLFSSNKTVYSRYMPYLLLHMKRLPDNVSQYFMQGLFVAKLSHGKFNAQWIDYVLEATENKALKGSGGIIGLTRKGNALARWFLARPITAAYSMTYHEEVCKYNQKKGDNPLHHSDTPSQRKQWDSSVHQMLDMFNDSYTNPLEYEDISGHGNLVNFATGATVTDDVTRSIVNCLDKATERVDTFVAERLMPDDNESPHKSFYVTLPRSNTKTMSEMQRKVKVNDKVIAMDNEVMFLRLLAVNAVKHVPLQRVMSYENSATPLSLFHEDGSMLTSTKSDFLHKLEDLLTEEPQDNVKADCRIYDGHAVIQMLPGPSGVATYQDMAGRFFGYILNSSRGALVMHIVFDKYLPDSIKNQNREKRGRTGTVHHIKSKTCAPVNWKNFLAQNENKAGLASYYTDYICTVKGQLHANQEIIISGGQGDKSIKITRSSVIEVPVLASNQEEADTRIVFHAVYAAQQGAASMVIRSPDTDVLLLLLHHRVSIQSQEVYFLTETKGKNVTWTRYIPVHTLHDSLTVEQLNIMLPIYCLTGCDTTSSFRGHGKRGAFRLFIQKTDKFQGLSDLGSGPLNLNKKNAATLFVGYLYGSHECESLNSLRCTKAAKNIPSKKLPPTEDSFNLNLLRCVYQLAIWRACTDGMTELPGPQEYGWERDDTQTYRPKAMSQSPAAPELLNNLVCDCDTLYKSHYARHFLSTG